MVISITEKAALVKKIDEFFAKEKLENLYATHELVELKAGFIRRCEAAQDQGEIDKFFSAAAKIFNDVKDADRRYKNVRRQEHQIRLFELKPGNNATVRELSQQMIGMIPMRRDGSWNETKTGYGDRVPSFPSSVIGGSPEAIAWVQNNDGSRILTEAPSKLYRNLVFDSRVMCEDDRRIADKKLQCLIENRQFTEQDLKAVRKLDPLTHSLTNIGEAALYATNTVVGALGKGLLSKSRASEDPRFAEYLRLRNQLIAKNAFRLGGANSANVSYLKSLQRLSEELKKSGGLLDQAQFKELSDLIAAEISETEGIDKKEVGKFNEEIQKLNSSMLADTQKILNNSDSAWKYRVFQVVLMLSPFAAINVFAPMFQILGPMFDHALTVGQGLGQVMSSDVLGPLGDIAHGLGVDQIPQVLDATGVSSVLDPVLNTVGTVFAPAAGLLSSPLIPLAAGGLAALYFADAEVKDYVESSDKMEAHKKSLEAAFESLKGETFKDAANRLAPRSQDFFRKRLNISAGASIVASLATFLAKGISEEEMELFSDLKFKVNGKEVTLKDLRDEQVTPSRMIEILNDSANSGSEVKNKCLETFLAYSAFHSNARDDQTNVEEFRKISQKERDELAKKQQERMRRDFIIGLGIKKFGPYSNNEVDAKLIQRMAGFFNSGISEAETEIFDGIKLRINGREADLRDIKAGDEKGNQLLAKGSLTAEKMLAILRASPQATQDCINRFLAYSAFVVPGRNAAENVDDFRRTITSHSQLDNLAKMQRRTLENDMSINLADGKKFRVFASPQEREKKCVEFENRIIITDTNSLLTTHGLTPIWQVIPSASVKQPQAETVGKAMARAA